MVVIRLARQGGKHDPKYRIVAADSRRFVTGKFLEVLG
ncbi:MAG: 30S ribosomal protein S16, partial [Bdellovibrionaceae bacterium]|nr:30S ribosomal protein S16 [Pseudobdellovibrionaceae bacterium]